MSHVKTFDDRMLSDALTYISTAMKKLEAVEDRTFSTELAIDLLEDVKDEVLADINERFERRRGSEEAYE